MFLENTENELSERLCSRLQEYRKPKHKTGSIGDLFPGRELMPRKILCLFSGNNEYSYLKHFSNSFGI
jgi:hypothetical protein